jgi:serine/threonine protein kinase/TolB-like protein/Flp pilus assembly protein TadD
VTSDLWALLQTSFGTAYSIERELGGGGKSRVFVAFETSLGRRVVVKVLPPELAADVNTERFRREIQLAAGLQHPLIVPVLGAGEAGGLLYYTMPFVDGESLRARLEREGELPINEAVRILRDVAEALAHAHARGVVHRDVKPGNVLLVGSHALVADFGVAKALNAASAAGTLTSPGVALGTPTYMAPEQAMADPKVDHRADIYALGAVAYEMLTGRSPFSGVSAQAMLAAHATQTPDAVTTYRPSTPRALAQVVMRCLEKHPADRWQSAGELVHQLEAVITSSAAPTPAPATFASTGEPSGTLERSRRASSRRVMGALAVGAFLVLAAYVAASRSGPPATVMADVSSRPPGAASGTAAAAASKTIAVLPFVDMSPGRDNEYFSDGVTEELINALGSVEGLRVASRTSAFAFKGKNADISEIGAKLKVATVLEGSVRKDGNRLRITAQLVNAKDGFRLWSQTYDREMRDVFAIQDELARAIVRALRVRLEGRDSARIAPRQTTSLEAYTLYLKGRSFWSKRTGDGMRQAVAYFERAIRIDSAYAPAYAGLADSWNLLAAFGHVAPEMAQAKARAILLKALELDSTLAEAHTGLAWHRRTERDWSGAERAFRRAIELKPSYATARQWYAMHLAQMGRYEEALREIRRAHELDPLSAIISGGVTTVLTFARRYDEAMEQARATLELHPDFHWAYVDLGDVLEKQGRYPEAIAAYRRGAELAPGDPNVAAYLAHALAAAGQRTESRRLLDRLTERPNTPPTLIARVHVALGEHDEAIAWLERAYESHDLWLHYLAVLHFDTLAPDPRFKRLLKRIGLPS